MGFFNASIKHLQNMLNTEDTVYTLEFPTKASIDNWLKLFTGNIGVELNNNQCYFKAHMNFDKIGDFGIDESTIYTYMKKEFINVSYDPNKSFPYTVTVNIKNKNSKYKNLWIMAYYKWGQFTTQYYLGIMDMLHQYINNNPITIKFNDPVSTENWINAISQINDGNIIYNPEQQTFNFSKVDKDKNYHLYINDNISNKIEFDGYDNYIEAISNRPYTFKVYGHTLLLYHTIVNNGEFLD